MTAGGCSLQQLRETNQVPRVMLLPSQQSSSPLLNLLTGEPLVMAGSCSEQAAVAWPALSRICFPFAEMSDLGSKNLAASLVCVVHSFRLQQGHAGRAPSDDQGWVAG